MQRQCAWCLRLMDSIGEPISPLPVPKIYEASHGMCKACGDLWLEHAIRDTQKQVVVHPHLVKAEMTSLY
jgi:hypothetical protein